MSEVEQAIFDGWRYLRKDALAVLSYTPREFTIMLRAQQERYYDDMETAAQLALMRESAHRAKRPKPSDLFKRPSTAKADAKRHESLKEKTRKTNEFLATLRRKE